jgi:hypothetical protein
VLLFVCGLAAPILAWRQLPDRPANPSADLPVLNRMETRGLAETLGAVAKTGDGVATYLTESSQSFFNFYSGIRRIDYVAVPENLPAYLSRPARILC